MVPDKDRLELLLLEGAAERLERSGGGADALAKQAVTASVLRLCGGEQARTSLRAMFRDARWSEELSNCLAESTPRGAGPELRLQLQERTHWPTACLGAAEEAWRAPPELQQLLDRASARLAFSAC